MNDKLSILGHEFQRITDGDREAFQGLPEEVDWVCYPATGGPSLAMFYNPVALSLHVEAWAPSTVKLDLDWWALEGRPGTTEPEAPVWVDRLVGLLVVWAITGAVAWVGWRLFHAAASLLG